jgi:NAD(P)-dependent dehydrogenase (short-subunit alcohol dehydrogenase family)
MAPGAGSVVIVGGTSGIGLRMAERYAAGARDVARSPAISDRTAQRAVVLKEA